MFSIHFKTSLPVTFLLTAYRQVQRGGVGMKSFVGRDGRKKQKKVARSGMDKVYVKQSLLLTQIQTKCIRD